ncbi:TetR/AcrR family transcriptional regulator [Polycyclovorans algicola]|uniref:TetR/AcrR family transcriptional regulator n=1 Tax=Polycyclovorans algicola TaxID=616992 RepID=UPI0006938687|nr:TetR/AcrR family transcriptional regulator [Polycyclovorans algicola]
MTAAGSANRAPAPRMDREARIAGILGAARALFQDRGFDAVSMVEIAGRVGVVEGLIYKYFPTKRDLLLAVLSRWYDDLFGDHARELAHIDGHRARLQALIRRHLIAVHTAPRLCRLMFREVQSERDYHGTQLQALNRRYTQLLVDVIEQGQADGSFRRDLPAGLLRSMIYGGIEHHSFNYVWGRGALDVDRLTSQITALICEGLDATTRTTA